jgi:hypothetical protein
VIILTWKISSELGTTKHCRRTGTQAHSPVAQKQMTEEGEESGEEVTRATTVIPTEGVTEGVTKKIIKEATEKVTDIHTHAPIEKDTYTPTVEGASEEKGTGGKEVYR